MAEDNTEEQNASPIVYKESNTTFDKIISSYISKTPAELSKKNEAIKNRWLSIWTNLLNFKSPSQAIKAHLDNFPNITQAVAYRDLRNATKLFGNLLQTEKDGRKAILYELAYKNYQLALQKKDLQAINKAWENMYKVSDLDKADDIHYNPAKLEDKPDKFVLDKGIESVIAQMANGGVVDLNTIEAEDVEYEEIKEDGK